MPMGYRAAISWLVSNDDIEWTMTDEPCPSVTATLVADIFDKTTEKVTADIRAENRRQTRARLEDAENKARLAAMQGRGADCDEHMREAASHRARLEQINDTTPKA